MHEYSITNSIIDILEAIIQEKNIKKVLKIKFEVSPFASIEQESIKFYYNFLTKDNPILFKAKLSFYKKKLKITCSNCGFKFTANDIYLKCPKCNSFNSYDFINLSIDDIKIISLDADF